MTDKKIEFYNPNLLLSHNYYNNIVVGARGIGKTFSVKLWLFKRFMRTGEQFIYLRRSITELDEIDKDRFFTQELIELAFDGDVNNYEITTKKDTKITFTAKGQEWELVISSKKILLNNKIMAYMKHLKSAVKLKGSEYDGVTSILFDEFMIDRSQSQSITYLPNEMNSYFNFLYSVFRLRTNVRVFLLGNATDINNPYYNHLNFDGSQDKRFKVFKDKQFIIEFPPHNPKDLVKEDNHPFFKMIEGTDVEKTIVDNAYQEKYEDNIHKIGGFKERLFSINLNDTYLSVYDIQGVLYVSTGYDKNLGSYCFNMSSIKSGVIYANRSHPVSKMIRKNYYQSNIIYDTVTTRNTFNNIVRGVL